ncbi:MAG: hypothetical protein ABSG43_26095 [Solirubrobacteraceae bacterium]|jgi:hypothetical protein
MIETLIHILLAEEHGTLMDGCEARVDPLAELDAARLTAPATVGGLLTAMAEELAWLGAPRVFAAANPAARRLFDGCDRCGEYALLRETDREAVGLCELCVEHLLRRIADVIGTIAGPHGRGCARAASRRTGRKL